MPPPIFIPPRAPAGVSAPATFRPTYPMPEHMLQDPAAVLRALARLLGSGTVQGMTPDELNLNGSLVRYNQHGFDQRMISPEGLQPTGARDISLSPLVAAIRGR